MALDDAPLNCRIQWPPPKTPTPGDTPAPRPTPIPGEPAPPPRASKHWLGTVVAVSDLPNGVPSVSDYASSAVGRWLFDHIWEYGFVQAPAESPAGADLGFEPWTLRWVGREMAAHLHRLSYESNPTAIVNAELELARRDLTMFPSR
jgi:hypothetical protein